MARASKLASRFWREPLLHFLVLAALLFALDHVFSRTQKEKILVGRQTVDYLIRQREDLELRELGPAERREAVEAFVEDEILYKEAYKRGLDKGDSRMRRNLIRKMRGLLIGEIEPPTEAQLIDFYQTNRERFVRQETLTLDHVLFSDAAQVPQDLLERLRAGADHRAFGEARLGLGRTMQRLSRQTLVGNFGAEAARSILAIGDDRWHGPLESVQGVHFVRIVGRTSPLQLTYEDVASYVEAEWNMVQSRRVIQQELERLQDDYEILIDYAGEAAR